MNILDEILATQVKILALLSASPVALAVSAEVGNDIAALATAETPVIVTPVVNPVIAVAAGPLTATNALPQTSVVTPVVVQTDLNALSGLIELDKDDLPHDIRINSKEPAKTVKNIWKSKKGAGKLDAAATEAVKVELRAAVAANPAAYKPFGTVAAVTPVVTTPVVNGLQTDPNVVTPIVGGAATTPIVTPVVNPVVAIDPIAAAKGEAITHVNVLSDKWKVQHDDILEVVGSYNNAKSFDELAPEFYAPACLAFKTWCDWLTVCQSQIDVIAQHGAQAGLDGVGQICSQYGVAEISGVHHEELNELHDKLKAYREQWDAAIAAAAG